MKTAGFIVLAFGVLFMLGAIANFNFTLGIEKSAMLIAGAIVVGAGAVVTAISYCLGSDTKA